jgi:chemotaxis protein methyltransferase CheR
MEIKEETYQFFSDYIFKHSGILYNSNDYYRLDARIKELMQIYDIPTPEELHQLFLKGVDSKMHKNLIDIGTNNESFFFRDIKPFKLLTKTLIPRILEKKVVKTIHIWSAACSYGQEPYSIVMAIKEAYPDLRVSLTATDISTRALKSAEEGIYDQLQIQRGLPVQLSLKYFEQLENGHWQIDSKLRAKVKFDYLNLQENFYPTGPFDIIFCRNVLIYFDQKAREEILNKMSKSMQPEGFLFMGSGESVIGLDTPLRQEIIDNTLCFVKKDT